MRPISLKGAICAALSVISLTLTGCDKTGQSQATDQAPASLGVETARIHLTAQQAAQTRSAASWPQPITSMLAIDQPLHHGDWRWDERGIPADHAAVRIDLTSQLVSVTRHGAEIGTAVILYGADHEHPTPLGHFTILSKTANYRSRAYDAPMPYALRLTADGVALHGSDVRRGRATHGCIGLPLDFARLLFRQMRVGDTVLIVRSRPSLS